MPVGATSEIAPTVGIGDAMAMQSVANPPGLEPPSVRTSRSHFHALSVSNFSDHGGAIIIDLGDVCNTCPEDEATNCNVKFVDYAKLLSFKPVSVSASWGSLGWYS